MEQIVSRWQSEKPFRVGFQSVINSQPGARKRIIAATGVSRARTYQWTRAPGEHCVTIADILGVQPSTLRPDIFTADLRRSDVLSDIASLIDMGEGPVGVLNHLRDTYAEKAMAAARLAAIGSLEKIGPLDEKMAAGMHGVVDATLKAYFNEILKGE